MRRIHSPHPGVLFHPMQLLHQRHPVRFIQVKDPHVVPVLVAPDDNDLVRLFPVNIGMNDRMLIQSVFQPAYVGINRPGEIIQVPVVLIKMLPQKYQSTDQIFKFSHF